MPIAETKWYVARCDGCGAERDLDGGEYQSTPENAEKAALERTGFCDDDALTKTEDGRLLCSDCAPAPTAAPGDHGDGC